MDGTASIPAQDAPPPDPRTVRHLHLLEELADIGMRLARRLDPPAATADEPLVTPEQALSFSRIARAVRQTLALESRLAEDQTARAAAGHARHTAAERRHAARRRTRLHDLVERSIEADPTVTDTDSLLLDLDERLDDPALDLALLTQPIGDIALSLCRELNIKPDLSQWTDEMIGLSPPHGSSRDPPIR